MLKWMAGVRPTNRNDILLMDPWVYIYCVLLSSLFKCSLLINNYLIIKIYMSTTEEIFCLWFYCLECVDYAYYYCY